MANGEVRKRGERRGEGVERRPPGEAERDASRAEDNVPLDARTKEEIEHTGGGRPHRGGEQRGDLGEGGRGRADSADPEPHDHDG
jgi:hypothetical protein